MGKRLHATLFAVAKSHYLRFFRSVSDTTKIQRGILTEPLVVFYPAGQEDLEAISALCDEDVLEPESAEFSPLSACCSRSF